MALPYDKFDKKSIIEFARKLQNKRLGEICDWSINTHKYSGKGNFGQTLEKYYFLYKPNSDSEPDFKEAGLELKSSPLKQLRDKSYRSKERLVLNIINYYDVVLQEFETSSFWKKNSHLLLVFYLHDKELTILDYIIKLVDDWSFPKTDLEIIKKDWAFIQKKVFEGKAHELSEGDTLYLGACTKGNIDTRPKGQPNNIIKAKQRAFSLKQGYVNHIIASIAHDNSGIYGKLIASPKALKNATLQDIVIAKFQPYYNKSIEEIVKMLDVDLNMKAKNFYANLTKAILNIKLDKKIEEFEKADIVVKTVRLKENNLPKEDISFPTFEYAEIASEKWEDSDFKNILERKFLFVFFQFFENKLILKGVKFWNMPHVDIQKAKEVWNKTKEIVREGKIVKEIKNGNRYTNFPNKEFNNVSHVRPHALNANDTYPLPVTDQLTGLNEYTKHCFWLNNSYIRDEIYMDFSLK